MKSYPNYQLIVPACYVKEQVAGASATGLKVFEVSWGKESPDYKKAHIAGEGQAFAPRLATSPYRR